MIGSDKTPAQVRGAFTLIELLIVVIILGVLGMIVVPLVSNGAILAREAAVRSDLRSVRIAIGRFAAEHKGAFPGSISDGRREAGDDTCLSWQLKKSSNVDGVTRYDEY